MMMATTRRPEIGNQARTLTQWLVMPLVLCRCRWSWTRCGCCRAASAGGRRLDAQRILTPRDFELLEQLNAKFRAAAQRKRRAIDIMPLNLSLHRHCSSLHYGPIGSSRGARPQKRSLEERLARGVLVAGRDDKAPQGRHVQPGKGERTKDFRMISKSAQSYKTENVPRQRVLVSRGTANI